MSFPGYAELLTSGKLNDYPADVNEHVEEMFSRLMKEPDEKEGITETLKAENQMLRVPRMNAVRSVAAEIVNHDLIYTLPPFPVCNKSVKLFDM